MDCNNIIKKSCLRTNKTNYCRVQFIDNDDSHIDVTPPASPTDCSDTAYLDSDKNFIQGKLAIVTQLENQAMFKSLYNKEKKKTELLELQIQHLQLQLMDRDRRLALNNDGDYKYSKVSHLINEILSLSHTDDDMEVDQHPIISSPDSEPKPVPQKTKQCQCTLENIHDRLQRILFNLMVTQQQQTRLQHNPYDDYQNHTTSIHY